jgi:hypothetical protein
MFIDIKKKLETDGQFRHALMSYAQLIDSVESKMMRKEKDKKILVEATLAMLKLMEYNLGLLVGYFFPKFDKGEPMTLYDRPFSMVMFHMPIRGYVCVKGSRQIGKSTSFTARDLMLTKMLPGFSSLYIAPQSQQTKTYADRLGEMYNMFRFKVPNSKYRQNLYLREFPGGSKIKLDNALTSADHIRGNTADQNLYDEYQGFDISLQPEIDMTMTDSEFDMTIYSGTSTSIDTALEARYQEGSQGVWHVHDPAGGWIDCGDKDVVMDLIQANGFVSPKTGRPLNVRNGTYVHNNEAALREGRLSVHVPQIIIPRMTESPERWSKIYQKKVSPNFDDKAFLQEVLGIATEEGDRELTEQHLKDDRGKYFATISACDWGGSDYNPQLKTKLSYTVHVVLGIRYDKRSVDILYVHRYSGMNYEDIIDSIMHHHKLYRCMAISSDFGAGMLYNYMIRKKLDNPFNHIVMQYTGPKTAYMNEAKSEMDNHLALNKTESLSMLYGAIKSARIHAFDWKDSEDFMKEFLNVIRVIDTNNDGTTKTFRYIRHGSKADDVVQAVNFGFTLCRIILGEPMC